MAPVTSPARLGCMCAYTVTTSKLLSPEPDAASHVNKHVQHDVQHTKRVEDLPINS